MPRKRVAGAPPLSHVDARGRVSMVDVGPKAVTAREAIATATEFSASIVGQAARLLQEAGVSAPGRFLTPLVHSTVDRALIEAGDGAPEDDLT